MATLAGRAYIQVAYDPASIAKLRATTATEGELAGKGLANGFAKSAPAMKQVGAQLTRFVTLPIVAAGAAATKYTYDFDQSLNHISALVGASGKQMEYYRKSILALAPAVGQGPTALADALYFVTSSGFKGAAAMKVLEASAKGAASGLGDTKTIADLVTSAVNVYGQKNLSAAHAVDVLTQAVKDGKGEPADYATALGRVIPIAQNAGVSFDQVGAALAALTLGGFSADKATTGLQSIFTNLEKPSTSAAAALHKVGLSAAGIRREITDKGLLPAMLDLNKAFDGNAVKLRQVFTSGKAIVPFLSLTGQAAKKNVGIFNDLANSTGASQTAFEKQSKTAAFQVQKSLSAIQVAAVQLGSAILPVFARMTTGVAGLASGLSNLSPVWQSFVIGGALVLAALGPVLSIIGNVTTALGALKIAAVGASGTEGLGGLAGAATALGGALGPAGLAGALLIVGGYWATTITNTYSMSYAMDAATTSSNNLANALKGLDASRQGVKQAELSRKEDADALIASQKALKSLTDQGTRSGPAYRAAVNGVTQAQLNLHGAINGVIQAHGAEKAATAKARVEMVHYTDSLTKIGDAAKRDQATQSRLNAGLLANAGAAQRARVAGALLSKTVSEYRDKMIITANAQERTSRGLGGLSSAMGLAHAKSAALALAAKDLATKINGIPTTHQILVYYKNHMNTLIDQANKLHGAIDGIPLTKLITLTIQTNKQPNKYFNPQKAAGGPVSAGTTYLTGERGPELFTPDVNGTIIPNDKLSSSMGGDVQVVVQIGSRQIEPEIVTVVRKENRRTARNASVGSVW